MNLNVSDTADSTKYVSSVSESDGKITVARESFSPLLTLTAGTTANAPKIKTTVAGNVSADIELTKASVGTNGVYGVTRLSSAINSSDETVAATPKAVKDAIESLDIAEITNTAGKTVATIDEADGKVSATFQDISITSAQISDSNAANKVLKLNASGLIDSAYLPSYVDDVIEGYFYNDAFYEEAAHTNAITGESGKIYVDLGGGRAIYRYSGSAFVEIPASPISDIQINGASIINNSVATVPLASDSTYGVVRTAGPSYGLEYSSAASGNLLRISPASSVNIKQGNAGYRAITPDNQHESVFYGLAKAAGDSTQAASENAVGTYTTDAQGAIRTMIGAGTYSKPSGGIPATDLAETYLTQHQSLSGLAPTESPEFTTQITIGNTTLTEAQLQALIAMLPENEEPQGG